MRKKGIPEKPRAEKECSACGGGGSISIDAPCERDIKFCESANENGHHNVEIDCPCCDGTGIEQESDE